MLDPVEPFSVRPLTLCKPAAIKSMTLRGGLSENKNLRPLSRCLLPRGIPHDNDVWTRECSRLIFFTTGYYRYYIRYALLHMLDCSWLHQNGIFGYACSRRPVLTYLARSQKEVANAYVGRISIKSTVVAFANCPKPQHTHRYVDCRNKPQCIRDMNPECPSLDTLRYILLSVLSKQLSRASISLGFC
jgi:hypothetical protein